MSKVWSKKKATGRARCKVCDKLIKKGTKDYYTESHHWSNFGYIKFTNHFHKKCLEKPPRVKLKFN